MYLFRPLSTLLDPRGLFQIFWTFTPFNTLQTPVDDKCCFWDAHSNELEKREKLSDSSPKSSKWENHFLPSDTSKLKIETY